MDQERLWVLINQELDRSNSLQEQEELDQFLAQSAEAAVLMEEMKNLSSELESLSETPWKGGMVAETMRAIHESSSQPEGTSPGAGWGVSDSLSKWPHVWLYPLGAGLLLGVLIGVLWQVKSWDSVPLHQLYATIGSSNEWSPVAQEDFDTQKYELSRSGHLFLIDAKGHEPGSEEIEFHYDKDSLGLRGISCEPACEIQSETGRLSILSEGTGRKQLVWELRHGSGTKLQVHARRDGILTEELSWDLRVDE